MRSSDPLLSIVMLTYNHAQFIEQAMECCLSQKTTFPFELIVCDDASIDGTAEIVREWASRHHNLVFLPQAVNGRGLNNMMDGLRRASGKYVAFCEGDDFWSVSHKLQKQVDFLEENPDFAVCCHKVEIKFEGRPGDDRRQFVYKNCDSDDLRIQSGVFFADEAIANYYFHTSSFVFRWRFRDGLPAWFRKWMMYDHALMMLHAVEGKIKYFDEAMSVWRRSEGGWSWLQNVDKGVFFHKEGVSWISLYEEMDKFFAGRFHLQIRERVLVALRGMVANCLETGNVNLLRKIVDDHKEWFLQLVKDNSGLFNAVRTSFPQSVERVPPWSGALSGPVRVEQSTIGGFKELDLQIIPESKGSVWEVWTEGHEVACFSHPFSALLAWVYDRRVRCLWLPVIYPRDICEELKGLWIPYQYYPVGSDFSPPVDFLAGVQAGDAVLTCSWMGRPPSSELRRALAQRDDVLWIDDRSSALWSGVPYEADVQLYCPSQVLGVPDGGILIGSSVAALEPGGESDFAKRRLGLLCDRFERGATDAQMLTDEKVLEVEHPLPAGPMSRFSQSMLERIRLDDVVSRCRHNWSVLHELLGRWALWPEMRAVDFSPTAYPILLPVEIPPIFVYTALSRKGILCSRFDFAMSTKNQGAMGDEAELLKRLLCLPCDHRYGAEDMRRVAVEVVRILTGESDFGTPGTRFVA